MLEVILVFAIVIGAAAVVFTVFQSASLRQRASASIEQVNTVAANVQGSSFAQISNQASLTNDLAIKAGILTPGLQTNAFGGSTEVNYRPGSLPGEFMVVIRGVPREACPDLLTNVMTNPTWTQALMSAHQPDGTSFTTGVSLGTHLVIKNLYSAVLGRCALSPGMGEQLDFWFSFNYTVLH